MFIFHSPPPSSVRKSFLRLVLLLTRLFSSSSDVGVKNLANSLTRDGPMRLRGSSWMSCNLSVSESLLLRGALAFSACTWLLDPLSLGRLRGYGGSGIFCNWRRWDGPRLVLRLTGNLLQHGDTLLLVSQVVHLASRHWMALTISCARKQAVERALHLKQFGWCRPRCTGWTACLWARSIRRRLWAALGWCLRRRTAIGATCTGALCAWAARWGTGQGLWRLASGGLRYRLRTGRLRVTGWRLWLSEVWMPFIYCCLLDWNEQIRVSHVQFKIPPVSGRGVTSGLPSGWNRHSAGHRVVPKPCHLGSSARLDPPVWHCLWN